MIDLATTLGMSNLAQTLTNLYPTDLQIENQIKLIESVGFSLYDLLDKYYTFRKSIAKLQTIQMFCNTFSKSIS